MKTIILVPGTFANTDLKAERHEWWKPGSPFCLEAERRGIRCLSFAWSTELDGVIGKNDKWEKGASGLYRQTKDLPDLNIIAHSHGGNVAIYAAALYRLRISHLTTLATPVRYDVPYIKARPMIRHWTHVYGGWRDWMQLAGSLFDRQVALKRRMELANDNIRIAGANHADLHEVRTWNENNLWLTLN